MNMTTIQKLMALSILTLSINATATDLNNNPTWDKLVKQYHQTKLEQFSAEQNIEAFESYLSLHPNIALIQLYTASSYCFVARDAWMPWTKLNAANTCIDKMEFALINAQKQYSNESNELLNSYLTFGLTNASLPDHFQQQDISVDILEQAKNHPRFSYLPEQLQQQVINTIIEKRQ